MPNWKCDEVGSTAVDSSVLPIPCETHYDRVSETETTCVSETDSIETDSAGVCSLSSVPSTPGLRDKCGCVSETDNDPYIPCTDAVGFFSTHPDHTNVSVVNSKDVQIGPRLLYNAPVVINQYVTSSSTNLTHAALKAANQGLDGADVVSSSPPKVLTFNGVSSPLLDDLWSWRVLKISLLVTAGVLVVCVALAVALSLSSSSKPSSDSSYDTPPPPAPPVEKDPNTNLPGGHRIFSKREWGGRPTRSRPIDEPPFALAHPTPYVIVSHTAGRTCFDPNVCSRICRDIQDDHMGGTLDTPDIAFNFLVGGDGNVYEGRGWNLTNARTGLNGLLTRKNIDVCFIGNFVHDEPTERQLNAAVELLDLGMRLGKLSPDYKLFSHNDTVPQLSPGKNIFVQIKDWPHFTLPSEIYT